MRFLAYILGFAFLIAAAVAAGDEGHGRAALFLTIALALAWYACHEEL